MKEMQFIVIISAQHVSPKFCSECGSRSQGPNLRWKAVPLL